MESPESVVFWDRNFSSLEADKTAHSPNFSILNRAKKKIVREEKQRKRERMKDRKKKKERKTEREGGREERKNQA